MTRSRRPTPAATFVATPVPMSATNGPSTTRRQCLQSLGAWAAATAGSGPAWATAASVLPLGTLPRRAPATIDPGQALRFPQDFGAHPALRTEWWYLTGQVQAAAQATAVRTFGFQVTFFRTRVDAAADSRSAFAAKQLVLAHTALTDLAGQRLWHDQRAARTGFGLADATEGDTHVHLRDWHLQRSGPAERSTYRTRVQAREHALDLSCVQTQPLLLQGEGGFSRKGPQLAQASHYYTQPQLAVQGTLTLQGQTLAVQGRAWLDHEWSEALLDADAVGWDWIGMNLTDGSALTAFRLRHRDGSTLWSGGSLRRPGQPPRAFANGEVRLTPGRAWTSPATQARYPVQWQVDIPGARYTVHALLDAQELDSRPSTGNVYWEGLSELRDAKGQAIGRGYLEMTGYAQPLQL